MSLHLSRVRLRTLRGEALASIAPLLIPDDKTKHAGHAHRVLWLLFQDIPDAKRDFLWRDEGNGKYMVLSARTPTDPKGLFEIDTKPFAPELDAGDQLAFSLRANPTVATTTSTPESAPGAKRPRGKRDDVVMRALYGIPKGARGLVRDEIATTAGTAWLTNQGAKSGFKLLTAEAEGRIVSPIVDGYAQVPVERRRGRPAGFSVLNFAGRIEITDPLAFLAKLPLGFGSAKAFGNGLMLIRRA